MSLLLHLTKHKYRALLIGIMGALLLVVASHLLRKQTYPIYVHYTVHYNSEGDQAPGISFETITNKNGNLTVELPKLTGLQYSSSDPNAAFSESDDLLQVKALPYAKVNLHYTYKLPSINDMDHETRNNYFIYCVERMFAFPDHKGKIDIVIDLEGFPEHYTLASSYGFDSKHIEIKRHLSELIVGTLLGGDLTINKEDIDGQPVYFMTPHTWEEWTDFKQPVIKELITSLRHYWNDNDTDHYIVFMLKNPKGTRQFDGRHRENLVVVRVDDGVDDEEKTLPTIMYLLAHELNHHWISSKLRIPSPQGRYQWFFEGFNDYVGSVHALRNELIENDDLVAMINGYLYSYYRAGFDRVDDLAVINGYSKASWYHQLAVYRGHIIARYVQNYLSKNTPHTLDDLIMELYTTFRKSGEPALPIGMLEAVFVKYLGDEQWAKVLQLTDGIGLEEALEGILGPSYKLTRIEESQPDYGFDFHAFVGDSIIKVLDPASDAYRAGLREGDKIKWMNVRERPELCECVVIRDEQEQRLEFYTGEKTVSIPHYVPDEDVYGKDPEAAGRVLAGLKVS